MDHEIAHTAYVQGFFVKETSRIRGFIISLMPGGNEVDDILQETFLTITAKAASFEKGTNFTAWAMTIARFKVMENFRKSQRREFLLGDETLERLLDEVQVVELDALLRASAGARRTYREIAKTHVLLDQHFQENDGADWATAIPKSQKKNALSRWLPAAIAAALAVAATWWIVSLQSNSTPIIVATSGDGSELLEKGPLILAAGRTHEISFLKGTRVALEGPLEIELISDERMKLVHGKIGVEVPKSAEGFTVETPDGEVIDYGTRFGLSVGDRGMRAEIFSGRIDVITGQKTHRMEGQASLEVIGESESLFPGSNPTSFPMPSLKEKWKISGSFNGRKALPRERPQVPNEWSGDVVKIVPEFEKITPHGGDGMLQFLGTNSKSDERETTASQLWRIVDLHEVRDEMGRWPERVSLSGWANRVAGDSQTDRAFLFGLSCHREITPALDDDPKVTTKVKTSLISDSNPGTWERADLQLHLPQNGVRIAFLRPTPQPSFKVPARSSSVEMSPKNPATSSSPSTTIPKARFTSRLSPTSISATRK